MIKLHVVREFGRIHCKKDDSEYPDDFENIYLNEMAFNDLQSFIQENLDDSVDIEQAFSVTKRHGKATIRVKNLVGVIQTRDGTTIEILPKIHKMDKAEDTRQVFLRMLRHLRNSPFNSIDNALLNTTRFPVLEVFITAFLDEVAMLIKQGLRKGYVQRRENLKHLRGAMDFAGQIRENLIHRERFFAAHDDFTADIPQNQVLKAALAMLLNVSQSPSNRLRAQQYLAVMDNVDRPANIHGVLARITRTNRLFSHYSQALKWARVFLINESFVNFRGNTVNKAILFPMERIFEDYVGYGFKRFFPGQVSLQDKGHYLVERHKEGRKFRIRPDIVVRGKRTIVLDTKWKVIDQGKASNNYEISQYDMYQLFAYGKKYQDHQAPPPLLVLLYPKHERFTQPLGDFDYGNGLVLKVIPVDLNRSPDQMIADIGKHMA